MNEEKNQYKEKTITFKSYNIYGFPVEGGGLMVHLP